MISIVNCSKRARCSIVNGCSHISVFIAGATRNGLVKSQARAMEVFRWKRRERSDEKERWWWCESLSLLLLLFVPKCLKLYQQIVRQTVSQLCQCVCR
jgi:hypothetical protein